MSCQHKRWLRHAVLFALIGIVSPVAVAEGLAVRLVVSDDSAFASETAGRLKNLLEQSASGITLERVDIAFLPAALSPNSVNLVVTLGDVAWQAAAVSSRDSPVLALMLRRHAYEALIKRAPRNASAIFLEQPVGRMLNLVSLLRPRDARVGVVFGPTTQEMASRLQEVSGERKQLLRLETVSEEAAVGRALARVIQDANILVAIPDPVVHTANTVQSILLMSYNAGIPVIGYSAAYQRAGALVSIYTTPGATLPASRGNDHCLVPGERAAANPGAKIFHCRHQHHCGTFARNRIAGRCYSGAETALDEGMRFFKKKDAGADGGDDKCDVIYGHSTDN